MYLDDLGPEISFAVRLLAAPFGGLFITVREMNREAIKEAEAEHQEHLALGRWSDDGGRS